MENEATYPIIIDNSSILAAHELAFLKVTSPSGKSLFIKKARLHSASDEQKQVFRKFVGDEFTQFIGVKYATRREMQVLLDLYKSRK